MKRIAATAALGAAVVLAAGCGGGASFSPPGPHAAGTSGARAASLLIVHANRGCHVWSLNGDASGVRQVARLQHGNGLTVIDRDVMPHRLVEVSGPAAVIHGAAMGHMNARATVVFPRPGVYRFTTRPGEDYTSGITTVGPDNTLRLTVDVS
jgi:hypothetical protein